MWQMKCGSCGESSNADLWLESAMSVKHPAGYRQCPNCRIAIKINREPAEVFVAGNGKEMLIPGKATIDVGVNIPQFDTVMLKR